MFGQRGIFALPDITERQFVYNLFMVSGTILLYNEIKHEKGKAGAGHEKMDSQPGKRQSCICICRNGAYYDRLSRICRTGSPFLSHKEKILRWR